MTRRPPHGRAATARPLRAAIAVAAFCVAATACTTPANDASGSAEPVSSREKSIMNSQPADGSPTLEDQRRVLEEQMPTVRDQIGVERLRKARVEPCSTLTQFDPDTDEVRWIFDMAARAQTLEDAKRTAETLEAILRDRGWRLETGPGRHPGGPSTTIFTGTHEGSGLRIIAEHTDTPTEKSLVVRGDGPCTDARSGEALVRSPLDGGFGEPDGTYDWEAERRSPEYAPQSPRSGLEPGPEKPATSTTQPPGPASPSR